jgi:hypothetical protein
MHPDNTGFELSMRNAKVSRSSPSKNNIIAKLLFSISMFMTVMIALSHIQLVGDDQGQ